MVVVHALYLLWISEQPDNWSEGFWPIAEVPRGPEASYAYQRLLSYYEYLTKRALLWLWASLGEICGYSRSIWINIDIDIERYYFHNASTAVLSEGVYSGYTTILSVRIFWCCDWSWTIDQDTSTWWYIHEEILGPYLRMSPSGRTHFKSVDLGGMRGSTVATLGPWLGLGHYLNFWHIVI